MPNDGTTNNVTLIDPNTINTNNNTNANPIPQYQNMYIYAELTSQSRGRTVITTNGGDMNSSTNTSGVEKFSFIGRNQDNYNGNTNYNKFTTNYYDGSTGNHENFESFGINSIKISINSSYVPQIDIQFVDIRGLSFFNENKSKYRILFDFPPPMFTLTIKGYYGMSLTYDLHLVKYTTDFHAENGNFIIDASFIAMTFAPLSDILFRYIINIPIMSNITSSPNPSLPVLTTNGLILKLRNLYADIGNLLNAESQTKTYSSIQKNITTYSDIIKQINYCNENINLGNDSHKVYLMVKTIDNINHNDTYVEINSVGDYDVMLSNQKSNSVSKNNNNRLMIGYVVGNSNFFEESKGEQNFTLSYTGDDLRILTLISQLNLFAKSLINNLPTGDIFTIPNASSNSSNQLINTDKENYTKYVELDITDFYSNLIKKNNQLIVQKTKILKDISIKTNQIVMKELGMLPTIYNIFKIILDDVDTVFTKLKNIAIDAENKHNLQPDLSIISGEDKSIDTKNNHVYAFPLIVKSSTIDGVRREERVAPIELSKRVKFPEMDFVNDFIQSFQRQRIETAANNARNNKNNDGMNTWMPISPFDSSLSGISTKSPYLSDIGSGNPISSDDIYKTILKRYYILTQGIIPDEYVNNGNKVSNAYINLYAKGEAVNLASVLNVSLDPNLSTKIKNSANGYVNNISSFYISRDIINLMDENNNNLYNFPSNTITNFTLNNNDPESSVFVDKGNPDFIGIKLNVGDIEIQTKNDNIDVTDNIIDKFFSESKNSFFKNIFVVSRTSLYNFSKENLIYIKDYNSDGDYIIDNISIKTNFLSYLKNTKPFNTYTYITGLTNGNSSYQVVYNGVNIFSVWSTSLGKYYDITYDDIFNKNTYNQYLSAMYIASNFGCTLGPFNLNEQNLNENIFSTPSIVETPTFFQIYVGALVHAIEGDTDNGISPWVDDITNFYNKYANIIGNGSYYIGADIHDIQKYLSKKDATLFKDQFISFYTDPSQHSTIIDMINQMMLLAKSRVDTSPKLNDDTHPYKYIEDSILGYINPKAKELDSTQSGGYYDTIILPLITRTNMLVYSQITFKMKPPTYMSIDGHNCYKSLSNIHNDNNYSNVTDTYFKSFFQRLASEIIQIEKNLKEDKENQDKITSDIDIVNQTYYSFKNISDKWLAGQSVNINGYPYNQKNKSLIDSFVFVDRAMNPIGDTIINAEILLQIFDNPDISVFSALSQILSSNGFEFFPLQNFMSFEGNNAWNNAFKIDVSGVNNNSAAFVCMFIGGSSSYPSVSSNGFENDGIIDISNPGVGDFSSDKTAQVTNNDSQDKMQENNNPNFPWRQVRAFRVKFGEQNQSMFTDIKIDSKEYVDTNESIQILSRLAGDDKTVARVPKGQNLYNLYENRSYKATVSGFGNAMIQPTQYFQLENIPLFNGAYIILGVEHTITPNKMTTSFSGQKILKYPIPRVLNPIAFMGIDDFGDVSPGDFVEQALTINNSFSKYNSMYTFKLQ